MKFQIQLLCSEAAGVPKLIALTSNLHLVRQLLEGLYTNYSMENDDQDRIFDPAFLRSAPALIAGLTQDIRREACRDWPEDEDRGSEEDPDC